MASVAYNDNWYDSSIKLIKASKKLFKTQSLDIADPKTFSKTLDTMTKQIALMQNQMFTKKRARVGIGKQTKNKFVSQSKHCFCRTCMRQKCVKKLWRVKANWKINIKCCVTLHRGMQKSCPRAIAYIFEKAVLLTSFVTSSGPQSATNITSIFCICKSSKAY
jgi:hypothetical protein